MLGFQLQNGLDELVLALEGSEDPALLSIDVFAQALSQPGEPGRRSVAVTGSQQATDIARDVEDLVVLVHQVGDRFDASASAVFADVMTLGPLIGPGQSRWSYPGMTSGYDCWALLESEEIARIAWNGREGVAVVPVNYTVGAGALWCRSSPDTALARECGGQRIVIEVDHLEPATRSGWSVVVFGVGEIVDAADVPEMLADVDVWPAGARSLFVRVEPDEVTGRKLLTATDVGQAPRRRRTQVR